MNFYLELFALHFLIINSKFCTFIMFIIVELGRIILACTRIFALLLC
jgi:hypothetical protein